MIGINSVVIIAFRALRANKTRSALTMLGIIIGVGAVITMLAVGSGASRRIASQISSIGSNLLIILSGSSTTGGVRMGHGTHPTLTLEDTDAIIRECPAVLEAAPFLRRTRQIVYGNQNWATSVIGSSPGILTVREWGMASGRAFTYEDVKRATKVCLLGKTVADTLFGGISPVDQIVRIRKVPFKVLGVLESKGQSPTGEDQDDAVFVPITTAQNKLFGRRHPGMIRQIMAKAKGPEYLSDAESQITDLLRQRHRIGIRKENDFTVKNLTQMMETAQQSANVMALLLGSIASVSLLVGGIGIMNIMLVSVTERTREIGIRMAVGARTWDIRLQFIIEALSLSLIGGGVGIVLGLAGSYGIERIAGWPIIVSPFSIVIAFGFSGLVGVCFGFYPAYKASMLSPIDALRHE